MFFVFLKEFCIIAGRGHPLSDATRLADEVFPFSDNYLHHPALIIPSQIFLVNAFFSLVTKM